MTEHSKEKLERVIKKIQLLLNRAEHAVEESDNASEVDHEAQSALELARKLMLQYSLEMEDVETVGSSGVGTADGIVIELGTKQTAKWALSLAIVVADYFDSQVLYIEPTYWTGGKLMFFGVKLNANMAAYAFKSVFNQVKELSRKYKVDRRLYDLDPIARTHYKTFNTYRTAAKREYREGLVYGFALRLTEMKTEETESAQGEQIAALAVRYEEVAKDWLAEQSMDVRERKSRRSTTYTGGGHYLQGAHDSDNVQIRKGLGEKDV